MAEEDCDSKLTFAEYIKQWPQSKWDDLQDSWAAPPGGCSRCPEAEEMYCVDCDAVFCKACCIRMHHPSTNTDTHSIEVIKAEQEQGVKLLSPFVEEMLLISILIFVFRQNFLKDDYLYSGNVCILTKYLAEGITYMDDKAFYFVKDYVATYCNIEDSYWRLFLDFWVRVIVTDSDSIFLLAMSGISAWLFKGALICVLQPIAAVVFGFTFGLIAKIEGFLPSRNADGSPTVLARIAETLEKVNVIDFQDSGDMDCPPLTEPRRRGSQNFVDYLWYKQNRVTRSFAHFVTASSCLIDLILTWPMKRIILLRLLCIMFPFGTIIRFILTFIPGVNATIAKHYEWFKHSSNDEFTDRILGLTFSQVTNHASSFIGFAAGTGQLAAGAWNSTLTYAAVCALIPCVLYAAYYLRLNYETWKFMQTWSVRREYIFNL
jgi:hypothetical protein